MFIPKTEVIKNDMLTVATERINVASLDIAKLPVTPGEFNDC